MGYDLLLGPDGDLPQQLRLVSGDDLLAQRTQRRLKTHLGEVLTDRTQGLDFIGWVQSGAAPSLIADRVRLELASVPGIAAVLTCVGTFTRATRTTTITAECQLLRGSMLTIEGTLSGVGNSAAAWRVFMRGMGGMWPA